MALCGAKYDLDLLTIIMQPWTRVVCLVGQHHTCVGRLHVVWMSHFQMTYSSLTSVTLWHSEDKMGKTPESVVTYKQLLTDCSLPVLVHNLSTSQYIDPIEMPRVNLQAVWSLLWNSRPSSILHFKNSTEVMPKLVYVVCQRKQAGLIIFLYVFHNKLCHTILKGADWCTNTIINTFTTLSAALEVMPQPGKWGQGLMACGTVMTVTDVLQLAELVDQSYSNICLLYLPVLPGQVRCHLVHWHQH